MRAGSVEEVDQGVAPPVVVGGLLLVVAIVEVFIGALIEAFPQRRRPRVVVVGEGVPWPVVPMPRRCVGHRQAARVTRSQPGGARSVTMLPGGDCSWTRAALGHAMRLYSPTSRATRSRGMRWTQSPLARVANSGTG